MLLSKVFIVGFGSFELSEIPRQGDFLEFNNLVFQIEKTVIHLKPRNDINATIYPSSVVEKLFDSSDLKILDEIKNSSNLQTKIKYEKHLFKSLGLKGAKVLESELLTDKWCFTVSSQGGEPESYYISIPDMRVMKVQN
jgi:hypothetical protein